MPIKIGIRPDADTDYLQKEFQELGHYDRTSIVTYALKVPENQVQETKKKLKKLKRFGVNYIG